MGKKHAFAILTILLSVSVVPAARADDAMLREAQECTRHLPTMERLYNIPAHWLAAIASTESGRYNSRLRLSVPWPWTINVNGQGYWFDTKQEAIDAARKFQSQGIKSMDVGCMQVNLMYHGQAFASLNQAFEPMYNVAYAAKFLHEKYTQLGSWTKATAAYHSMQSRRGAEYYSKVYKKWQQVVDRLNDTMLSAPQTAWKEAAPEKPQQLAAKEEPPVRPYHVARPPQQQASQPQQRVRWNSIEVTRGPGTAAAPVQQQPQAVAQQAAAGGRFTMASRNETESGIPGFPSEALTPLDLLQEKKPRAADSGPSRKYERGVLVVRANPAQRRPPQPVEKQQPVAVEGEMPAAKTAPASQPDKAAAKGAVTAKRGQFAPVDDADTEGDTVPGEFVDEKPKPKIAQPKFIF